MLKFSEEFKGKFSEIFISAFKKAEEVFCGEEPLTEEKCFEVLLNIRGACKFGRENICDVVRKQEAGDWLSEEWRQSMCRKYCPNQNDCMHLNDSGGVHTALINTALSIWRNRERVKQDIKIKDIDLIKEVAVKELTGVSLEPFKKTWG